MMITQILHRLDALWRRDETTIAGWWMVAAGQGAYFLVHLQTLWPTLSGAFATFGVHQALLDRMGAALTILGAFLVTPREGKS